MSLIHHLFSFGLATVVVAQIPNLAPARQLPGTPRLGAAADSQRAPALAAGATATLLVFEDRRAGDLDLFGVRLDAAGVPLDAVPFPIAKDAGDQTRPQVCWNGSAWLVVYQSQFNPGSNYFAWQTAARRVSAAGAVLDAAPIVLAADDTGGGFAVASDGSNWAVAYTGYSAGNSAIAARRISAAGVLLDPAGVILAPATYFIYFSLGASHVGNAYVFSWADNGMRARRFDGNLQPLDTAPLLLNSTVAAMATNHSQLFLAWVEQTPQFVLQVVGARVDAALQRIDAQPLVLASGASAPGGVAAVWDGSRWIASWSNASLDLRAARVSGQGQVLDPGGVLLPEQASTLYGPTLGALAAGGAVTAWSDYRNGVEDVFGVGLSGGGTPGGERCLSVGSEAQLTPRVAAGAEQYLVTYRGMAGANQSRILAQRLDALGQALDAEPVEVAAAAHGDLLAGGAAWNGALYLVVWSDGQSGQVLARRLRADGTFVDAAPIPILAGGSADVAALGGDFLVTALRAPSYPQYVFSYGARVRGSDGAVLDTPALALGPSFATRARVAAVGNRWLVVTESHWSHDNNQANVMAQFVDAQGAVTTASSLALGNIQDWGAIDVASAGTAALVVWQSGSNWTNCEVLAQRILPDGTLPGGALTLTGGDANGQSRATVAWTGAEYVVAYQTYQNNSWFYDLRPDVYAVRVSAAGALVDSRGFALWNGTDHERTPHAAGLGQGRALFAASTYVDAGHAAFRIQTRSLRPAGLDNFGTGTAGCRGPQHLSATGAPRAGNLGFALRCDAAPAGAGVLALADRADRVGTQIPALGIRLHLDPAARVLLVLTMAGAPDGVGIAPLPVPADPTLTGLQLFAQALWPWAGACPLPPLGLSASDGLVLVLQP